VKNNITKESLHKACEINRQKVIVEICYFHNFAWKALYEDTKKIYDKKKERCEQYEIS
jgi:hypothetical protein